MEDMTVSRVFTLFSRLFFFFFWRDWGSDHPGPCTVPLSYAPSYPQLLNLTSCVVKSQRNWSCGLSENSHLLTSDPGLIMKTRKSVLNPTTGTHWKRKHR
jgi:hypothetical protein